MKNLPIFLAFTFLCSTGICFAQPGGNLDARVTTVTRSMSAQLGLNEMDYIKLRMVNYDHMAKAAEINSMYSNNATVREMKITELQADYENQLRSILNSKQMEAYAAYKENKSNYTAFSAEALK
ncbi:hypothetical protein I5M27_05625 [Adhaeribacter sp. BT258]|uniref:Uncharacterized protein n=1 Tax=Adhaeribacter terrigena TaxID=2793070 RepID=A0ABS1C1M4_9BACT|nr:hypothetical protein [Adhaeribacter terrigena]MBK0402455.1 hypothetical protein [Adhaeribacter terrigena]